MADNEKFEARPEPNRFLARQPILDRKQKVIGYEILFRSGWINSFSGDGNDATRQVLDNLLVAGVDSVCERKLAFVNCTREALLRGLVTLLPAQTTVLEILETIEPDEELISACRALKAKGYRIALDDFVMRDSMKDLVKLADYVKIDFRASGFAERQSMCRALKDSGISLLAEKVETEADFHSATAEGFTSFQGYFFCCPVMVARHEIPPNRLTAVKLLCALSRSPMNLDEVELLVKSDPALCYRLLRLVNSPLYPLRGRIENVMSALLLIGEREIRKLAIITLAASLGRHGADALLHLSTQRARFCELAAPLLGLNPTEQYLVGLMSLADAFLALPMSTIVERLPLRPAIRSALLGNENRESRALQLARHFETGDWEHTEDQQTDATVSPAQFSLLYAESVRWAVAALSTSRTSRGTSLVNPRLCSCEY